MHGNHSNFMVIDSSTPSSIEQLVHSKVLLTSPTKQELVGERLTEEVMKGRHLEEALFFLPGINFSKQPFQKNASKTGFFVLKDRKGIQVSKNIIVFF